MSLQGKKALLLPNEEAGAVFFGGLFCDGGISFVVLPWSVQDAEDPWEWWYYDDMYDTDPMYNSDFDPWEGVDRGFWNGSEWIEDEERNIYQEDQERRNDFVDDHDDDFCGYYDPYEDWGDPGYGSDFDF